MKYIVTLFWSCFIGSAVFYIGTALAHETYALQPAILIALALGVIVTLIGTCALPKSKKSANQK